MIHARPAVADDLEFLWSMLFYASHADEQPGATFASIRDDPDLNRYLLDWGRDGDLGVVAMDDEQQVGAAWLRRFMPHEQHLVTYISSEFPELAMAVEPDRIGRGIGSLLLTELLSEADDKRIPAIVLSAREDNPAVRLYRRFGFVEIDHIVNRVGTSSVRMVRERGDFAL